jgi:hypothetical protein
VLVINTGSKHAIPGSNRSDSLSISSWYEVIFVVATNPACCQICYAIINSDLVHAEVFS